MPVVPGFKYDLFISYAHKNDRPWRWVTEFAETLRDELEGKSRDFRIWWDPGLRTGEDFNIAIGDAISESAVFLSVLSLAYGDSTYCKREIEEFRQQRHPAFGITVGSMSRMQAVVIDRDFTADRWAPEFRVTSPCPFYNDRLSLFSKPAALASSDPWIQGLWKVRDSIWATLQEMKRQKEKGTAGERTYDVQGGGISATPVVCVAEVTDELYRRRESLRSSLSQTSDVQIRLWTDPGPPPASGPNVLTVHLFGKYPGRAFGDSDLPLPRLQLEATVQAKPARRPLAWFAGDLNFDDAETDEHRRFLKSLEDRNDIELLRTDFEDLKEELQKRMRISTAPAPKTIRQNRESPIVHIWHTIDNPSILSPLKQYLNENDCGISVYNCASTQMDKMQSKLAICDGLIIPYTPDTRTWAEDIMSEAFRWRRHEERPIAFAAVELPPATEEDFNFEHPRVIPIHVKRPDTFQDIDHFLAKLEQPSA
jgi:hypothetical protein